MDKVIKIQSLQGSGFDAVKRLCEFDIPAGGVYDLSSSYVNLVAQVETQDSGADGGQGVYEIKSTFDGKENVYPTVSFIKNAHMSCAKHGQIANTRKVDTLQSTLHQYTKSFQGLAGEEYHNPTNTTSKQFTRNSIFRELHKEGTEESLSKLARVTIPLKDVFDYCNYPEYDSDRHGATRLNLELQVDKFVASTSTDSDHANSQDRNEMKSVLTPSPLDNTITTLTTKTKFRSLEESPYFVGMKIDIEAVPNPAGGNPTVNYVRKVTGIQYTTTAGADNKKLVLTLSSPILNVAPAVISQNYDLTVGITDITAPATVTTTFSSAELVLRMVGQPRGLDASPRPYQMYLSEEYQANGASPNHQYQVNVEPNCSGVYIMYPDEVLSSNGLVLNDASYRLRHNGMDKTNRNVPFFTPVHKERLLMTLSNSGYPVRSLIGLTPASRDDETQQRSYQGTNTLDIKMIGCPLKPMPEYSLLQVNHEEMNAPGLGRVIVYKEIQTQI